MRLFRLDLVIPLFFAASGLVVVSGFAKLRDPGPAGRALGALRIAPARRTVQGIGLVEIGVGTWCLLAPSGASAACLSILYVAFAAFLALLMRADGSASCGCLGNHDARPTLLHIVMNMTAAAAAGVAAGASPRGVFAYSARLPVAGLPFLLGTALIAYLAYLTVAYLPAAFWAYRRPAGVSGPTERARAFVLGSTERR